MLHINHTPDTNRVNPAEYRYLRTTAHQLHQPGTCFWGTVRAVVVSASVALGLDLTQEEKALRTQAAQPTMTLSHYYDEGQKAL
ncbi:hypothetical protein F0P96_10385 [Hymenobacter busanensis]|uniref:Uncharacterized protein n=1 Tax=Hymenobacter busanensis TaxID=2607656 RepID=A0A7L4ZYD6_9BACT|nr:hypothetical protein [Hymenobacter busanensis]KAA9333368.1 hypothetical protein F0P96_10385 [Hymenobacter busanensis]QHJ07953.1 hypothetical protein GUY19_11925 [Hymenobacter busanensis]